MDFFAEQARQRAASRRLILLFALAVATIVALVDAVAWTIWRLYSLIFGGTSLPGWKVLALITAGVAGTILACSFYRMLRLAAGGRVVADAVLADKVPAAPDDPRLQRLRNVVEEMAIAAGVPVPGMYVLPDESGINAFAAGCEPRDAVICVTQGCLDHLSRDELQGVVAHEFSHVLNGDMRLNIRVMGLLYGIQAIGFLGRRLLDQIDDDGRYDRRQGGGIHVVTLGIALLVIGYVGVYAGRMIQAALSRSRESLADASAVQFTRQTDGLVGALKKIGAIDEGSYLCTGRRGELAHMLFAEGDEVQQRFATHPPLLERIRALDPGCSATALKLFAAKYAASLGRDAADAAVDAVLNSSSSTYFGPPPESLNLYTQFGAAPLKGALSFPPPEVPGQLSGELAGMARNPESAAGLVLAYALSPEWAVREGQSRTIESVLGESVAATARASADAVDGLPLKQRHLLLALAVPALKRLAPPRRGAVLHAVDQLVRADGRMELREYVLLRLLRAQLRETPASVMEPAEPKKLAGCRESYSLVCAVLACHGSANEDEAKRAWWLALQESLPGEALVWPSLPPLWQDDFDRALDELDHLGAIGKELALRGWVRAIMADGTITGDEAQLLRLICASLHCMPPAELVAA